MKSEIEVEIMKKKKKLAKPKKRFALMLMLTICFFVGDISELMIELVLPHELLEELVELGKANNEIGDSEEI